MSKAKVYLIPNFLGLEVSENRSFPSENKEIIASLSHFAVENLKDTRRFLVRIGLKSKIDESEFYNLDKNSGWDDIQPMISALKEGHSIGIISDAGCPGIADPGSLLVKHAHINGYQAVPLIGPSSIFLALMASGFSGQSFSFKGYLDRDSAIKTKEIREMENLVKHQNQTQIFMETPYRNEAMWEDLIQTLQGETKLCVAANISLPNEYIKTKTVAEWKKSNKQNLAKIPAIFLLGS
ncbi:MAG: 16S rRNA (cytidine1402-2'-O)-methyltransferase [Vicingaceae bacterium]|jgi:16S rRNA (cytidine1402-2'-O)-methyltransferase|tara:strand:+ start:612 stop:1325 length:714 start_codon:yes stop_codon:yes gene_type:complete